MGSETSTEPPHQRFKQLRRIGKCAYAVLETAGCIVAGVAPVAALAGSGFVYFETGAFAYQAATTKTDVTDAWIASAQPLQVNQPATLEVTLHQTGGDTNNAQFKIL